MTSGSVNDFGSGTNNFAEMLDFLKYFFKTFKSGYAELNISQQKNNLSQNKRIARSSPEFLPLPVRETTESFGEKFSSYSESAIEFGAAPRFMIPSGKGKSGAAEAVAETGCIWSEIQYAKAGGVIGALEKIESLPLRPSIVVDSGGARQIYYLLKEPLRNSKLLEWKKLMTGLSNLLETHADFNPGDKFPLPGSFTFQSGSRLACRICREESSMTVYAAEELAELLTGKKRVFIGCEPDKFRSCRVKRS